MEENQNQQNRDEFFDLPPTTPIPSTPPPTDASQPKPKKANRFVSLFLALCVGIIAFFGGWYARYYSLDEEIRTFLWALSVSKNYYYQELDDREIYERLYDVLDLDPYTQLFFPDEFEQYQLEGQGQNVGIGISISEAAGKSEPLRFFLVVENSPASRAGIRKGMYLLGFGESESSVRSGDTNAFLSFLSGQTGEFVLRCGYDPDGSDAALFTLKRESYQAAYCHYRDSETSFRFHYDYISGGYTGFFEECYEPLAGLDEKTAYIRLDEFSGNAADEFVKCLSAMKDRGRTHLILDLRTDGGGYLDILTQIASHLLKNATGNSPAVAKAVYRGGRETVYRANGNDFDSYFTRDSKIYVLADENTASASECLIGALVDYGSTDFSDIYLRQNESGVAKSYGKGIMQSHYLNASGAAMKLTVAEMRWPVSGKSIHGVGVVPADGAIPISADLIWGKSDPLLENVLARVCAQTQKPNA